MVDMSAIAGALSALKGANDIAQAMIGLRDAAAFQSKLIEFQAKIIEANNSAFAAQDERTAFLRQISNLESEVAALKAERSRLQRYELKDFGGNTFAYQLKESEANGEPIHRACPNCYGNGHISILQFDFRTAASQDKYVCHSCKSELEFGQRVSRRIEHPRGPPRGGWV
jgi:hypothetical protein